VSVARRASLLALVLLASCGASELSGSVGHYFSLDFTREEILRGPDALQITYYRDTETQVEVVARLTVVTRGFDFTAGHSFDLSGEYAPGHPRAVVTHAAGNEPSRALPALRHGTLTLKAGGAPGEATRGSFSLSFQDQGGDFGQGTNLSGKFDAVALNADPDGASDGS